MDKEKNEKEVSIIIPTYNRRYSLFKCLEFLNAQTYSKEKMEVIIIDNNSTDRTGEMVNNLKNQISFSMVYKYIKDENCRMNKARNMGVIESKGEYLLFLDSDMYLKQNALENMILMHKEREERGEDILSRGWWLRTNFSLFNQWHLKKIVNSYDYRKDLSKNEKLMNLYKKRENLNPEVRREIPEAFILVKRKYVLQVDGFAEQEDVYGLDYEFQIRIKNLCGLKLVFNPEAFALHGPLIGDITNNFYKKAGKRRAYILESIPRKGLSSRLKCK